MNELKIIVLCSSRFALPAIYQLAYFQQLAVVLIPENCKEMIAETREALKATNIPVITATKENFAERASEAIHTCSVNMGLVLTFSYIIPRPVFELPVHGFYNVHPGPLPAYRGADPIFYQIKNREPKAGVCIHKLDAGRDTGPVVLEEKIMLPSFYTYGMLSQELAGLAAKLIDTLTKIIALGFNVPSRPQNESKAHYYKKQSSQEFTVNWQTMDADSIIALMNACNPHNKGAATKLNHKKVHLISAEKDQNHETIPSAPGTILFLDDDCAEVAVINSGLLKINFVYTDEGFVSAGYLKQMGAAKGMMFENLF
ncbi:MAG: hypothetical protein K2X48_01275 [Chitinophagaceae bacterium]|nr:hypothetical protein [Chitinophagaceae bacterium]